MPDAHDIRIEPVAAPRAAERVQHAVPARRLASPAEPKADAADLDLDVAASTSGHLPNAYAQYLVNPDTHEVIVRIRDASTDEILSELPSPEVQAISRHMKEYAD